MNLGIDVGGTFTDFVYIDNQHKIKFSKVLTTYPPEKGVREGLKQLTDNLSKFVFVSHSTTLGLNAYISNQGAKIATISTKGFRDTLEIARTRRLFLYDLFQDKPEKVLADRFLRFEIDERMDRKGNIINKLDVGEVKQLANKLKKAKIDAVAITLIHSYANPIHERQIKNILTKKLPNLYISISSDILPEYREYERTFATALNSYIGPIMSRYLDTTANIFSEFGYKGETYISQSNGGLMSTNSAKLKPVYTIGSGPASGVMGGIFIGKQIDHNNLITLDMGGTTCLVSLVDNGKPKIVSETTLENRLKLPMIDVRTIGAGGGSIAWADKQGAFHVGPESARAYPGPACYDKGGNKATVTDANLFLGYLDEKYYLGGKMRVKIESSKKVIKELANQLNIDILEVGAGIKSIVESNMTNNISEVSVWRGYDPREFTLIAFGGGAGLHCVNMAEELGIKKVISPPYPAIMSALGHLVSDIQHFYSKTYINLISEADVDIMEQFFIEKEKEALKTLKEEKVTGDITVIRSIEMRYKMQSHELNIIISNNEIKKTDLPSFIKKFQDKHEEEYGYVLKDHPVEIATLRLQCIGKNQDIKLDRNERGNNLTSENAYKHSREVYMPKTGLKEIKVYDREKMRSGMEVNGPSLIDGLEATVFIPDGWKTQVDDYRDLIIIDVR